MSVLSETVWAADKREDALALVEGVGIGDGTDGGDEGTGDDSENVFLADATVILR